MKLIYTALLLHLLIPAVFITAGEKQDDVNFGNPFNLIGMDSGSAYELLGPPDSLHSLRGEEEWQDDVVFFFNNGLYLYWYENRIWQVRIDENSSISWEGIKPGLSREVIWDIMGKPPWEQEEWEVYNLSELPFPLRLRIFYRRGKAVDFYLYRGDF